MQAETEALKKFSSKTGESANEEEEESSLEREERKRARSWARRLNREDDEEDENEDDDEEDDDDDLPFNFYHDISMSSFNYKLSDSRKFRSMKNVSKKEIRKYQNGHKEEKGKSFYRFHRAPYFVVSDVND